MADDDDRALYGGVEGGGSKFLCGVVDASGHELASAVIPTADPGVTLPAVAAFFAPYRGQLRALGVACFGPLALARGELLRTPKPGWSGVPLCAPLVAALGVPVLLETDVNGAALAERRFGALRGTATAAYVTVGTGVGVGVLVDGEPLHGLVHPELGHLRSHDPAFAGICPFHGACIEGLVSAPAIRARTGSAPEALPPDHPVWERVASTLGELLHAIVLAYAPERVVLGGGVLQQPGLRAAAARALQGSLAGYLPITELEWPALGEYIVAPALGLRAGLWGAYALAGLGAAPRSAC